MVNIYYKNGQLDKYKTCKSFIKYYVKCAINKEKPRKITVATSINGG